MATKLRALKISQIPNKTAMGRATPAHSGLEVFPEAASDCGTVVF
jgi:hypothetical protein